MILIILIFFIIGFYLYVNVGTHTNCPNLLVQHGNKILLKNTNDPSVNIVFHSLDEYTNYLQKKNNACPVLEIQKVYNAQNEPEYREKPALLVDATRGNSPYNDNLYPGMDPHNQTIGQYTMLDTIPSGGRHS